MKKLIIPMMLISILVSGVTTGCSKSFWGGAAAGAVGTGAAYELRQNSRWISSKRIRAAGRISEQEYQDRKQQIEKGSVIY